MQFDKAKIVIILICCFLGASIIAFVIKSGGNLAPEDKPIDRASKEELSENKAKIHRSKLEDIEVSNAAKTDSKTKIEHNQDLADLTELLDADPADMMDMEWNSREITSDFTDRSKIAVVISAMPIKSDTMVSEEQLNLLQDSVTEMIFDNGNNDYDSYLKLLKQSGEKISEGLYERLLGYLKGYGITEEEISTDPFQRLSQYYENRKRKSRWKGLVSEGSEIRIFETRTSRLETPGRELEIIRQAITTYPHPLRPPISLDEMLKTKGKALIADVKVFIAHEDAMVGIVRPYVIRYWFDSINNFWRPQRATAFQNRKEMFRGFLVP